MTDYFTGIGGAAGGTALTWDDRRDTITNLFALGGFGPADRLIVGPGTYREAVTLPAFDGQTRTSAGTIDVTNESTGVVGNGTNFALAQAGDYLFVGNFESGANGQTWNNNSFTVAGGTGNFQPGHVGFMIEIITKGTYIIASVVGPDSITILNPNQAGVWPAASAGFNQTFYVVSGEGPYEIASIGGAAALTLVGPWSGPTLNAAAGIAGVAFEIYRPISLIADVSGIETDGVGGVVRLTGTANDQTQNLLVGITGNTRAYWHIRGFYISNYGDFGIDLTSCDMTCIEDCVAADCNDASFRWSGAGSSRGIIRRCVALGKRNLEGQIIFTHSAQIANTQCLVENVYVCGSDYLVQVVRFGGLTVKNLTGSFANETGIKSQNMTTGHAVFVHDCQINYCWTAGLEAGAWGMIVEQHNNLWQNAADRILCADTIGTSTGYAFLPMLPSLIGHVRQPMTLFAPSEWEPNRYASGLYPKNEDLFGVQNMTAQTHRSWGAIHAHAVKRSTTQIQDAFAGSLYMEDAAEQMFTFPVQPSVTYIVSVWIYVEPNYTGTVPQMNIRQPGETDVLVASTGAAGVWEQISTSFTTGTVADWISVGLRSNNTSTVPLYGVYWQNIQVT